MASIALDKETKDIVIDGDGCLLTVTGCEEISQCIKQNIEAIDFVPLLQSSNAEVISSVIKSAILNTNGVTNINNYSETLKDINCGNSRGFIINFNVSTICGNIAGAI